VVDGGVEYVGFGETRLGLIFRLGLRLLGSGRLGCSGSFRGFGRRGLGRRSI
jgi:hypothetical protein